VAAIVAATNQLQKATINWQQQETAAAAFVKVAAIS